ncbi:hypothetical protein HCU40_14290 [Pseudanabaena biceps]|nr:hypothetical protein [Pseudanabaena biceps]
MQLQQIASTSFPNFLKRYVTPSLLFVAIGLSLSSCGNNTISQCNEFITLANKVKALPIPQDAAGLGKFADGIEQIRTEIEAVNVQDAKIKEVKSQLLGMYGDAALALKSQAQATTAKDKTAIAKAKQDLEAAAAKEADIVNRLNSLCAG